MKFQTVSKKIFVGLSGGVDSAVSAALLKQSGYEVTGLFVKIAIPGYPCSVMDDRREALRVAAHLEIPFEEVDLSEAYRSRVFDEMLAGYRAGETPNPDTLCNREIKFGLMYEFARSRGADFLATGHYAQVKQTINNKQQTTDKKEQGTKNREQGTAYAETHLLAGIDSQKDQSYFLYMVPRDVLEHVLFPVGGMQKAQVRALAEKYGLPNAARRDSQGICFLGALSMEELLARELHTKGGAVLDTHGQVIGTHHGAALYTIGQRHGFLVEATSAHAHPFAVVAKDVERNTITVAPQELQEKPTQNSGGDTTHVTLRDCNWIGEVRDGAYRTRFRYRQPLIGASLKRHGKDAEVNLDGVHIVPPGQSLVLYDGDRCLGGGIIKKQ